MLIETFETRSHDTAADAAFDRAVYNVCAHRAEAGADIAAALDADPDHVATHVLKGFANVILARQELLPAARASLRTARHAAARNGGASADERALVDALDLAVKGKLSAAADALDHRVQTGRLSLLALKISYSLRFMGGDTAGMLRSAQSAVESCGRAVQTVPFVHGLLAFAHEELGDFASAERHGRLAVAIDQRDAWGQHAVAHVFEMRGDWSSGISWLQALRPQWSRCNNFSFHMAWHLALFHLERGAHDEVLALYDEAVRPAPSDDFRDIANAASLLWRLKHMGVDVGKRAAALRETVVRRKGDTTLVFAALHNLIALVAGEAFSEAEDVIAALERKATGDDDQAAVARRVGLPLARAILARSPNPPSTQLTRIAADLGAIGGSHAQRDVFLITLAERAAASGDHAAFVEIRSIRAGMKREDSLLNAISHLTNA